MTLRPRSRPGRDRAAKSLIAVALATGAGGCGSDDDGVSDRDLFGKTDTASTGSGRSAVVGHFDVGGRELYLKCTGRGSPTVVHLHSGGLPTGESGAEQPGRVPSLLEDRYRVCVYDRANVGRSDNVAGRLTGMDSVRDLHALLGSAGIKGPYVLLGSTLGGAIADLYAARHPKDVAGMVLLASTLPADLERGAVPPSDSWRTEPERLDRLATYRQAARVQGEKLAIPVTYIAAATAGEPSAEAAIGRGRRAFLSRFSPGRLTAVDVPIPHDMAAAAPERVAREVERVIAAAK